MLVQSISLHEVLDSALEIENYYEVMDSDSDLLPTLPLSIPSL